jgi:gliding motility-associated-like protein
MKTTLCFFFFIFLQKLVLSQLPTCKDSFPASQLLNSSFEQYSGCYSDSSVLEGGYIDGLAGFGRVTVDNWHSFANHNHEIHYFNYNCNSNKPESVFGSTPFDCNPYPRVPLPLPGGAGFISINEKDVQPNVEENKILKTYITTCPSQPLKAGETYVISFYLGFATQAHEWCLERSPSPCGVAIFGRQDCLSYPLNYVGLNQGCLTNNAGWVHLGSISLQGYNEWTIGAIEFTPRTDISSIGIGPDCTNHNHDTLYFWGAGEMYYMDNIVLAPKTDFSYKIITAISGDVCSGHYKLKAPPYPNVAYEWYKDNKKIPNATSQVYIVPDTKESEGNYVVNIIQPTQCLNSLPFPVKYSELINFKLGEDTLLCSPGTITLNADLQSAVNYVWQDGTTSPLFDVKKSGLYWVQITDRDGCMKKDSINITIQDCSKCRLFIPSAFTPNGDGLNDIFRVKPECAGGGLFSFELRVYDRSGQLVFTTKDINKGWDGMYKNHKLGSNTFVYFVNYSFEQNKTVEQKGVVTLVR